MKRQWKKIKNICVKTENLRVRTVNIWKKFRKTRMYSLVIVLVFIAVCMGIGSLAAYIHHESDPTEVAVEYFRAFIQQDYDTVLKLIDTPEGGYIDKTELAGILSEQKKNLNVDKYEILNPDSENGRALVVFRCFNEEIGEKTDFKVYLNKFHKGLNPIPDYKISVDDLLIENYTVTIPKGDKLTLNRNEIHDNQVQVFMNNDGNKTYVFSSVLRGEYDVSAENDYGIRTQKVSLTKENLSTDLSKITYEAKPQYLAAIEQKTRGMLQQYYTLVRKKKLSNKELQSYFAEDITKKLKKLVKKSIDVVFWSEKTGDYEVVSMNLSDQKITATYNKEKHYFEVQCSYNLDYECATQTSLLSSYTESYVGNCKTTINMCFNTTLENIKITDITIKNKNKKIGG